MFCCLIIPEKPETLYIDIIYICINIYIHTYTYAFTVNTCTYIHMLWFIHYISAGGYRLCHTQRYIKKQPIYIHIKVRSLQNWESQEQCCFGEKRKGRNILPFRCLDNSDNTTSLAPAVASVGVSTPAAPAVATQDIFESQFLLDLLVVFLLSASQPRYETTKHQSPGVFGQMDWASLK